MSARHLAWMRGWARRNQRLDLPGDSRTMVKTVKTVKTLENGVWTVCLALTVETLKTLKEKTLKDKKSRH